MQFPFCLNIQTYRTSIRERLLLFFKWNSFQLLRLVNQQHIIMSLKNNLSANYSCKNTIFRRQWSLRWVLVWFYFKFILTYTSLLSSSQVTVTRSCAAQRSQCCNAALRCVISASTKLDLLRCIIFGSIFKFSSEASNIFQWWQTETLWRSKLFTEV